MEVIYKEKAVKDIAFWKKSGNLQAQKKISNIIEDIKTHPYTGIAKPEPLKYNLYNWWSREINEKDRFLYCIENDCLIVISMRGHYYDK